MNKNNEKLFNVGMSKKMHSDFKDACNYYGYTMRSIVLRSASDLITKHNTEVGRGKKRKRKVV